MTATVRRTLRWIEQAAGGPLRWNQTRVSSDAEDAISSPSDRTSDATVAVVSEVANPLVAGKPATMATVTQTRLRYAPTVQAALRMATIPVWDILAVLYGQKWPVEWFHYDVTSQLVQFRLTRTIAGDSDAKLETTTDSSVLAACNGAVAAIADLLSIEHKHPITPANEPAIEEPAPTGDLTLLGMPDSELDAPLGDPLE